MNTLDLDIQNYEIPDLERFFRLDTSVMYDAADVELKETEIRSLLMSSGHIEKHMKRDLIFFLESGKQLLIDNIPKTAPSTIRKQRKIDPVPEFPKYLPPPSREENIIYPPQKQVAYTQSTTYAPGTMNPIDRRTLSRCLSIDTRFRQNPYQTSSSDFTLNIPNKIQKTVSVDCTSFEIVPRGIPNVSASLGNNFLYVSITTVDEKETCNVFILPTGHYNQTLIIETFNYLFSLQKHSPFLFLEMMIDPLNSGKVILSIDEEKPEYSNQIKHVTLDFNKNIDGVYDKSQDYFSKMGRMLGFTKTKYTEETNYMSETIMNPYLCIPYFYLSVEDFQNRSSRGFENAYSQITIPQSVIARIVPARVDESETTAVQPLKIISIQRQYFGPVDLNRFQIRLLDPYGKVIDMNYNDYSFCLKFETIYES
jgi:hypothetical protein